MRPVAVVADLHAHTTVTDGRLPPAEVIDLAAGIGLENLVFTDHSAVTFASVVQYATTRGVRLPFPGMEVSTFLGKRKHHLLLYGSRLLDESIERQLCFPIEAKLRTARLAHRELWRRGYRIAPLDEITAGGTSPDRPTPEKRFPSRTAFALRVAESAGMRVPEAYDLVKAVFSGVEREAGLADRYLPTLGVLELAVSRGLTVCLAHPLWECSSNGDVEEICASLRQFTGLGMHGMESRSYHHRAFDDHPALLRAGAELGLVPTGGSDFHGNGKTELGSGGMARDAFEAFSALVGRNDRGSTASTGVAR